MRICHSLEYYFMSHIDTKTYSGPDAVRRTLLTPLKFDNCSKMPHPLLLSTFSRFSFFVFKLLDCLASRVLKNSSGKLFILDSDWTALPRGTFSSDSRAHQASQRCTTQNERSTLDYSVSYNSTYSGEKSNVQFFADLKPEEFVGRIF